MSKILTYKNIFAKGYYAKLPNYQNTVPWTCVVNDLSGEEIIEILYEKELQKTNQEEFSIIKIKGTKLYVKWKGYGSSFNSWIDKKDIVK